MTEWLQLAVALPSFLVGGVPFAYVLGRLRGIDLRTVGSGNPGASNAFRNMGPALGIAALLLDAGKAVLCVWLAGMVARVDGPIFTAWFCVLVGLAVTAGHVWSPFMGWRGGKGVGPMAGVLLMVFPVGLGLAFVVAALVILIFKKFSLGSLIGAAALPVFYFILFRDDPFAAERIPVLSLIGVGGILIVFRHVANIRRLIQGRELGLQSADTQAAPQGDTRRGNV